MDDAHLDLSEASDVAQRFFARALFFRAAPAALRADLQKLFLSSRPV